jgi:GPH family glycoside/pentoside/hexuronide:cation symporter
MAEMIERKEEKIPLRSRVWLTGADGAVAFLQTIVGSALTLYFLKVRGMTPETNFIVWILFLIWNSVNDPLFGYISDRTKSKLGRRIPYIRYGAPFLTVAYIICWLPIAPPNDQLVLFFQLFFSLFFYDALYTAIATAIYVMPYEMAVSNKARSSIFIWKMIFALVANLGPLFILPLLNWTNPEYTVFHIILAIIVGVITFASTFFYKENKYLQEEKQPGLWTALKESFKNKPFLNFEVSSFTVIYAQTGILAGAFLMLDDGVVSQAILYGCLLMGILVGAIIFMKLNPKKGVRVGIMFMMAVFAVACFVLIFLGKTEIGAVIGFFGIGIGFAGGFLTIPLMNGDVIDYDEERSKLRREGMYAGINSFISKPAISIANAVAPLIASAYGYIYNVDLRPTGYVPDDLAITGLLLATFLIPAILLVLSCIATNWYPLHGPQWDATKKQLEQVHKEKEKAFLEKLGYKATEK